MLNDYQRERARVRERHTKFYGFTVLTKRQWERAKFCHRRLRLLQASVFLTNLILPIHWVDENAVGQARGFR